MFKIACQLKQAKPPWRITRLISHALGPGPPGLKRFPDGLIQINPEVAEAIVRRKPVVALESTIITHGMPYPENLRVAKDVERIVRENGATPATVAVIAGKIHVGLSEENLEKLAHNKQVIKTSRRDLPYVISKGLSGATTVSGTMIAAHATGIPVFVTGGIGGVHRDAQSTFDISADLTELGRTPVAVICAGVKSILDIELTLEYLETQGVLVSTFGDKLDFPAFFTPESGFKSPYNVQSPVEAAKLIDANLSLGSSSGIVIAVPISKEESANGLEIEKATQTALKEARDQGVLGKEVTPFVLQRVNDITEGQSLQSNIALIKNNARVGSSIAVELCKIRKLKETNAVSGHNKLRETPDLATEWSELQRPVVIGGSNVDFIATAETVIPEASNPGQVRMSFGGVGRNLAECLARLGLKPILVSAVGTDPLGVMLLKHCEELKMMTRGIYTSNVNHTATYSALMSQNGDYHMAVGDMNIHKVITPDNILAFEEPIRHAPLVMLDSNISQEAIDHACSFCGENHIPVWFEPTCILKSQKPFLSEAWHNITYASPNLKELKSMNEAITKHEQERPKNIPALHETEKEPSLDDILTQSVKLCRPLMQHVHCVIVTLGKHGVLACRDTEADTPFPTSSQLNAIPTRQHNLVSARHFPSVGHVDIGNVTGAGDSLAATMAFFIIRGHPPDLCVKAGLLAAHLSLQSPDAIPITIDPENFTPENVEDCIQCEAKDIDCDIS